MDTNTIIEGTLKFRDGKKWKSRWCVLRKLSPVADCVHVQLYRDSKDRYNNGQTKASLSLQYFLAVQSGFTLDKESNTIAILCEDVTVIFAFDTREQLIQWQAKIAINLGEDEQFLVQISSAPPRSKLVPGPARLHVLERRFCLTAGVPPRLLGHWQIVQLRKYGVINGRFCFEGGSQCGRGEGLHVLLTDRGDDVCRAFRAAAQGHTPLARHAYLHVRERSISSSRTEANLCEQLADCRSRSQENLCWSSSADWSSVEPSGACHREGTVSRPRCRSCHVRLARSSTVTCAPGSGFTWTMESCGNGQILSKSPSCLEQQQSSMLAPVWDPASPGRPPPRPPKTKLPPSSDDMSGGLKRPRPSPSMPLISRGRCDCDYPANTGEEYYDTPRSFKNTIPEEPERSELFGPCEEKTVCRCKMTLNTGMTHSFSVNQALLGFTARENKNISFHNHTDPMGNLFFNKGHIYQNEEEPSSLSSDPGWSTDIYQKQEAHSNCCCYMNVKANTLCQAKRCLKSAICPELSTSSLQQKPNYENIYFAESLKYYENCKDCYNKLVSEFERDCEFSVNSKMWVNDSFCRNCILMRKRNLNSFGPATSTISDEMQGYIKMSSLANIADANDALATNGNKERSIPLFLRPRSKSSICLQSACRHPKDYKIRAISDPEIHLIPSSQKRPKISLSKLIDLIRNLRPVTAQEIQRHARKSNVSSFRNRLEESQYHSDDTISSDTMVNTANDMSVKGSINSLCSENARHFGGNRFLSTSELNLTLSSVPNRLEGKESEMEKYKEHLRNLQLPQLPVDFKYKGHGSTCSPAVRRSCTVNFKPGHNRDSSSSNDSGVSTASLRLRRTDFTEFEMPITSSLSAKLLREYALRQMKKSSSDLSLPRRSKSIDPLGELVFQFQESSSSAKSTSALLAVVDGREGKILRFIDAPSTSSGTSDLSDYMDNLSISSYSSNEHTRISRCPATTLKPRSGKEYHKIGHLSLQPTKQGAACESEDQSAV